MNQDPQQPLNPQPEQPTPEATPPTPVVEQPQAPQYAQPLQPAQPVELAPVTFPGKALGIASFVVSLIGGGLIAMLLGIIALRQSKAVGRKNGFALAGIIIGAISIVAGILFIAGLTFAANSIKDHSTCTNAQGTDGSISTHCTLN